MLGMMQRIISFIIFNLFISFIKSVITWFSSLLTLFSYYHNFFLYNLRSAVNLKDIELSYDRLDYLRGTY